jgi:hypothetical protein
MRAPNSLLRVTGLVSIWLDRARGAYDALVVEAKVELLLLLSRPSIRFIELAKLVIPGSYALQGNCMYCRCMSWCLLEIQTALRKSYKVT